MSTFKYWEADMKALREQFEQADPRDLQIVIAQLEESKRNLERELGRASKLITISDTGDDKAVRLAKPPKIYWSGLARFFMTNSRYKSLVEPHIADMQQEVYECLGRGDEWGARRAVIRGNIVAVPSWLWGVIATGIWRIVELFKPG
jgi:hypothetical protein